jgi:hypothetical protein
MEQPVEQVADNILKQPGVAGVACLDRNGFCLVAKGSTAESKAAVNSFGLYKAISRRAAKLSSSSSSGGVPIIKIEIDSPLVTSVTIKDHEDMTIVVHRS